MRFSFFMVLLGITAAFSACTSDDKEQELRDQLAGRWEISQAFRNERPTTSLENLYFDFYGTDSLRTNLNNGRAEAMPYEIKDQTITPVGSQLDAAYTIQELSDTSLILISTINRLPFRFLLRRAE